MHACCHIWELLESEGLSHDVFPYEIVRLTWSRLSPDIEADTRCRPRHWESRPRHRECQPRHWDCRPDIQKMWARHEADTEHNKTPEADMGTTFGLKLFLRLTWAQHLDFNFFWGRHGHDIWTISEADMSTTFGLILRPTWARHLDFLRPTWHDIWTINKQCFV